MQTNFGAFNGRSRMSRLNLVQDNVEDRQQSIAKARLAREERERQQKRRRAGLVIHRAICSYAAKCRLVSLATTAMADELQSSESPHSIARMRRVFSLAYFLRRTSAACHEELVVQLVMMLVTAPLEDVRRCTSLSPDSPLAMAGVLWAFGGALSSRRMLPSIVAACPPTATGVGSKEEPSLLKTLRFITHDAMASASVEALWVDVLCSGIRTASDLSSMDPTSPTNSNLYRSLERGLAAVLDECLRSCRELPVSKPWTVVQLLSLPNDSDDGRNESDAGWKGILPLMLFGSSDERVACVFPSCHDEEFEACISSLLDSLIFCFGNSGGCLHPRKQDSNQKAGRSRHLFHCATTEAQQLPSPLLLCNALRRLIHLCPCITAQHLIGRFATLLILIFEHLSVGILADDVPCALVISCSKQLFEPSGGLCLLQRASSSLAVADLSADTYHSVTALLSTPATLAQMLGDESDRTEMISCLSRLLNTPGALEDLTFGFVAGGGVATSGGVWHSTSASSLRIAGSSNAPQWLVAESPLLSVSKPGCPSLFLQVYSYFVDCGMFTKDLIAAGGTPSAPGASFPTKIQMARSVVRTLREVVVRAHFGCDSFQTEVLATRCSVLFAKLFAINELQPFCDAQDWWCPGTFNPSMVEHHWHASLDEDDEDDDIAGDSVVLNSTLQIASRRAAVKHQLRKNYFAGSRRWTPEVRLVAILRNAPCLLPFETRVAAFARILHPRDALRVPFHQRMTISVRRECVFEDAFVRFKRQGGFSMIAALRQGLSPQFEGEAGFGDGVYRDFMLCLCAQGFAPEHGLFSKTDVGGFLYPNPASEIATDSEHLNRFRFLGAMVGKALFDGILLSVPFSLHFRNALLGRRNTFDHLASFDPQLYRQLSHIRDMDDRTIDDLALTFTATSNNALGDTDEKPLVPNGQHMYVSGANVAMYVQLYADFRLNRENEIQTKAFQQGLHETVESTALQIFGSNELDKLFQGDSGIDVEDWAENTVYAPPSGKDTPVVQFFWQLVRNMTNEERRVLLGFVTSARRAPLLGFRHMVPHFTIAVTGTPVDHLPSAATCFCQLKLPQYSTFEETRDKLMQAMAHGQTFELS